MSPGSIRQLSLRILNHSNSASRSKADFQQLKILKWMLNLITRIGCIEVYFTIRNNITCVLIIFIFDSIPQTLRCELKLFLFFIWNQFKRNFHLASSSALIFKVDGSFFMLKINRTIKCCHFVLVLHVLLCTCFDE